MPTYPIKNLKTGETKELVMSMKEYDEFRKDNPDWDKDRMAGVGNYSTEVGDWQHKMSKTHPGWSDIMKNKILPKAPTNTSIAEKWG